MININEDTFRIIVKPNSKKNEILGYDKEKEAYIVRVKAPAVKGKANRELIKFLSKELKKRVIISKGLTSRQKTVVVEKFS